MKKKLLLVITLLLITFGVIQGTLAIFREETKVDSPISAGKLGIEMINASNEASSDNLVFDHILPNKTLEHTVSIRNSKDKELYVRITLTRYWTDEKGKKVTEANADYIQPIMKNSENWIVIDDGKNSNQEIIYYYYKLPLNSKDMTTNLLDQIHFSEEINDSKYSSYQANIILEAEAIQKVGAKDAMLSQWGIEAAFTSNDRITTIEE